MATAKGSVYYFSCVLAAVFLLVYAVITFSSRHQYAGWLLLFFISLAIALRGNKLLPGLSCTVIILGEVSLACSLHGWQGAEPGRYYGGQEQQFGKGGGTSHHCGVQLYNTAFARHRAASFPGCIASAHFFASVPNFLILKWQSYFHTDPIFKAIVQRILNGSKAAF
jgi:hypothetical protein